MYWENLGSPGAEIGAILARGPPRFSQYILATNTDQQMMRSQHLDADTHHV